MRELALLWLTCIVGVGLCLWFVYDVVKRFGWPGLPIKCAVFVEGLFLTFVIALHQFPWVELRNHVRHVDDASFCRAMSFWVVWSCFLFADCPMRWLMKPPVRWALYSAAALVFVGAYAARKGWL
jgi:hypothetical protein